MSDSKISFEWALEGKEPGSYHDYELLGWSEGRLSVDMFQEIRNRYSAGMSNDLPQVTIAVAATREQGEISNYIALAVQEWSGHRDATNRKIAYTRWFYVPYDQLKDHRVSYETLYRLVGALPHQPQPPLTVTLPQPPEVATPGPDAVSAAAFLLTGHPVCVVGADSTSMIDRLRFVDAVASLLPYGMRTKLTAATWASSSAEHKIKLSFARYAPDNAYEVVWGQMARIPVQEHPASVPLKMLTGPDVHLPHLVDRLAEETDPLSFASGDRTHVLQLMYRSGRPEDRGAGLLRIGRGTRPAEPPTADLRPRPIPHEAPSSGPGSADTLDSIVNALARAGHADLDGLIVALARHTTTYAERLRVQQVLTDHSFFGSVIGSHPGDELRYGQLMSLAFPHEDMTFDDTRALANRLIGDSATPKFVRRRLKRLRTGPAPVWLRWRPPPVRGRPMIAAASVVLLAGIAAAIVLIRPDPQAPAPGTATPQAKPITIAVFDEGDDRYVASVLKQVLSHQGYEPRIETADATVAYATAPTVLVAYDLDLLERLSPESAAHREDVLPALEGSTAATGLMKLDSVRVENRDVLVFNPTKIKESALRDALRKGEDITINVRDSFGRGMEAALREDYPHLTLKRLPAGQLLRELGDKTVKTAIVPQALAAQGYTATPLLDGSLPERTLIVLSNTAVDRPARGDLTTAISSIDMAGLGRIARDSPDVLADEVIRQLGETSTPNSATAIPGTAAGSSSPLDVRFLIVLVLSVGLMAAVVLLLLMPTRPIRQNRSSESAVPPSMAGNGFELGSRDSRR